MDGNLAMNSHFENMSDKDMNDMQDHYITLDGNKLIAQFMGYKFAGDGKKIHFSITAPGATDWYCGSWSLEHFNSHIAEEFKYHSSWELLMPVVEKISRIEFERRWDEDLNKWVIWTHHPVTFGMLDEQGRPMVRFYCSPLHSSKTLIEATWNAVVDFIKSSNDKTTQP